MKLLYILILVLDIENVGSIIVVKKIVKLVKKNR
jgi:hypothetical protein